MLPNAFAQAFVNQTDTGYLADLNAQCHRNAQIASTKYRAVQSGMKWLFVSVPLWLLACYFLYKA